MRKILLLFAMLMGFAGSAFSQTRTVTGTVLDETGSAVPFASISVKGSGSGVSADADGKFSISAPQGSTLIFTAVGYQTQTIIVNGEVVNAVLRRNNKEVIEEVVVTALGQTKAKASTGYSSTVINSETLNRVAQTNPLDALAGKVPGANISKTGGPGSSVKVVLRGFGIISGGSNQPLYVVDGIPMTDARFQATGNYDFGQTLGAINPNDIENITVLRGTAAVSLYGSQARNGAIMITTKKARGDKFTIEYAGSATASKVGKLPDYQETFGQGWGGVFIISENGSWGPKLDGKDRLWGSVVDNSQLIKPFSFIGNNLRNFYQTGIEYNNAISFSGGGDKTKFYFSYNNVLNDGVIPTNTDYFGRNNISLRTNSVFDKFTINTSLNFSKRKINTPYTGQSGSDGGSVFEEILQIPVDIPFTDFKDYKNKFFNVDNYFTPFAENPYYPLHENRATQDAEKLFGNFDIQYKFHPNFTAQLRMGGDFDNARTFAYKAVNAPKPGSWNGPNPTNPEGASRAADVGSVNEATNYIGVVNGDFILRYKKNFASDFNLETMAGYNYYQQDQKVVTAGITNLLVPGVYNLSNSTQPPTTTDAKFRRRLMGVYAQAILDFREQLFLTLNARNDWSSTLPINNNSIFYPGANLSWIASKSLNMGSGISLLKFRAAYGQTGSDPAPYQTVPTLVIGSINLPFGSLTLPFNNVSGFGISNTIANAALKPIITTEAELGTEVRFFGNRIGLDLAVYDKRSKGQIFTVPIAPSTGYTGIVQNLGEVSNKGIELAFDVKPVATENVNWTINYNFTKNWNKVVNLEGGPDFVQINSAYDAEMRAYPGKNIFGMYAPVPVTTADGKIVVNPETGMPLVADDKGFYGNADYDYMMGLSNNISYKNLMLNFSFDYRKGGIMYTGTGDLLQFTGNGYVTTYNDRRPFIVPNSVYQDGTDGNGNPVYVENTTVIDEAHYDQYWYHTTNKALAYYNRFMDRSFLKLRDISLSYRLPQSFSSKLGASNLLISVYGSNFLLWTPKSNVYIDPEASNFGNDIGSQFGEFRTSPTSYQFGISLKAKF